MPRNKLLLAVRDYFSQKILHTVNGKYRDLSLAAKCRQALDMLNIRVKMAHGLRRDLKIIKKNSGLIISNHPSDIEQLILPVLCDKHPRFKIIVKVALFDRLKALSQKHFMKAALPDLEFEAPDAISNGHLVALFPSGGPEHKFRRGFVKIVEKLSPKTMVYCINIDEKWLKHGALASKWRQLLYYSGLGSELFFSKWLNINRLMPVQVVNVDGQMVRARDFQAVMAGKGDDFSKAQAAQDYYDRLFNRRKRRYRRFKTKKKPG